MVTDSNYRVLQILIHPLGNSPQQPLARAALWGCLRALQLPLTYHSESGTCISTTAHKPQMS